jgi:hypothetical protein
MESVMEENDKGGEGWDCTRAEKVETVREDGEREGVPRAMVPIKEIGGR